MTAPELTEAEAAIVARFEAAEVPAEVCRTCRGRTREPVGMVCQTCGTDYAPMTAVDLDALDKLRGALIGLGPFLADTFYECTLSEEDAAEIAAVLLPVVDRIANERAAAGLRAAADLVCVGNAIKGVLRERADALDPT